MNNYQTIQALRLIAALLVAMTHATFYIQTRIDASTNVWDVGSQGVQIFFVISGFVMALSSGLMTNKFVEWHNFILKRIIRIAPLYWIMNLIKLAMLSTIPGVLLAKPDIQNIILSLLFIPSRNESEIIETFYGVGWTLNFEIFFYLLITIFLYFKKLSINSLVLVLLLFICIGSFREDNWPAASYLFHLYLANFIWGLLIAKITSRINIDRPILGLALVIISSFWIFINPLHPTMILWGIQYGVLVLGLVMLESKLNGKIPKVILFGGEASFSIYLTHAMSGPVAVVMANKIGLHSLTSILLFTAALMLLVGAACFHFVEKPITKTLFGFNKRN